MVTIQEQRTSRVSPLRTLQLQQQQLQQQQLQQQQLAIAQDKADKDYQAAVAAQTEANKPQAGEVIVVTINKPSRNPITGERVGVGTYVIPLSKFKEWRPGMNIGSSYTGWADSEGKVSSKYITPSPEMIETIEKKQAVAKTKAIKDYTESISKSLIQEYETNQKPQYTTFGISALNKPNISFQEQMNKDYTINQISLPSYTLSTPSGTRKDLAPSLPITPKNIILTNIPKSEQFGTRKDLAPTFDATKITPPIQYAPIINPYSPTRYSDKGGQPVSVAPSYKNSLLDYSLKSTPQQSYNVPSSLLGFGELGKVATKSYNVPSELSIIGGGAGGRGGSREQAQVEFIEAPKEKQREYPTIYFDKNLNVYNVPTLKEYQYPKSPIIPSSIFLSYLPSNVKEQFANKILESTSTFVNKLTPFKRYFPDREAKVYGIESSKYNPDSSWTVGKMKSFKETSERTTKQLEDDYINYDKDAKQYEKETLSLQGEIDKFQKRIDAGEDINEIDLRTINQQITENQKRYSELDKERLRIENTTQGGIGFTTAQKYRREFLTTLTSFIPELIALPANLLALQFKKPKDIWTGLKTNFTKAELPYFGIRTATSILANIGLTSAVKGALKVINFGIKTATAIYAKPRIIKSLSDVTIEPSIYYLQDKSGKWVNMVRYEPMWKGVLPTPIYRVSAKTAVKVGKEIYFYKSTGKAKSVLFTNTTPKKNPISYTYTKSGLKVYNLSEYGDIKTLKAKIYSGTISQGKNIKAGNIEIPIQASKSISTINILKKGKVIDTNKMINVSIGKQSMTYPDFNYGEWQLWEVADFSKKIKNVISTERNILYALEKDTTKIIGGSRVRLLTYPDVDNVKLDFIKNIDGEVSGIGGGITNEGTQELMYMFKTKGGIKSYSMIGTTPPPSIAKDIEKTVLNLAKPIGDDILKNIPKIVLPTKTSGILFGGLNVAKGIITPRIKTSKEAFSNIPLYGGMVTGKEILIVDTGEVYKPIIKPKEVYIFGNLLSPKEDSLSNSQRDLFRFQQPQLQQPQLQQQQLQQQKLQQQQLQQQKLQQQKLQQQQLKQQLKQKPINIPILIPLPIGVGVEKKQQDKFKKVKAYQLLIKKAGKFQLFGKPQEKGKAIKLGAKITKATLASTFKIKPTKVLIIGKETKFIPSEKLYRTYKVVRGKQIPLENTWIEKRTKRLTTKEEKGLLQSKRKVKGGMKWL